MTDATKIIALIVGTCLTFWALGMTIAIFASEKRQKFLTNLAKVFCFTLFCFGWFFLRGF